ncbi:MAG: restriction endonuclease subunit S [Desulfobacterales bacterium]|nr:restriction endonuclease subunit S [Desulfobacterales bacterium]
MEVKPGYKQTEVGVIPEEWEVVDFDALGRVIDGDRGVHYPNGDDFSPSGYCLFLNAGNVSKEGFNFVECMFISREKDAQLNQGKLKPKDIVLTTRGTVGNLAYFDEAVPFANIRINSGMVILRNESLLLKTPFLYRILQSRLVQMQIERLSFGSVQPQLTVKGISKLAVVVPPLPEQQAVAEALGDVDTALGVLVQLMAKKRYLKEAATQQLLTGKVRLPGFCGEWKVKRLGDIGSFAKGKGIRKDEVVANGLPCIRYGEIYTHYNDYIRDFFSFIPARVAKQSRPLRKGDLLFAGSGETAGEIGKCVAFLDDAEAYAGGDIVVLSPTEQNSMYLGYLMNHPLVTEQKARMGQGDAVVHISARSLAQLKLRLPEETEQTAIADVLADMDAEIAALEQRLVKTRALKQGMMQELLTGRTRLV